MSTLKALLKDVPVEWKELKEVCIDFIVPMRDRPKTFDGPIPWCRIEDIEDKYFNKSKLGLGVSNDIIRNMNLKVFPTGTVICSCSASIGVYAINTQPLITNQTFIGLVCGSNLYNRYLLYFMETQTANLLKIATTGTIPYISRKKFEDFKVLIPYPNDREKSLAIQQEIVRVLDGLSEQNNALTTALAQEIAQRKKQYEYYREELFRFEGKEVEWKTLGEVARFINGRAYKQTELLSEGKYPVLRVGNFFTSDKWYYSNLELHEDKYCENGDLLYAWSASFGPKIWNRNKVIYHYHIWKVQPDLRLIDKKYLYHLLLWDTNALKSNHSTGSTMVHITKGAIESRTVPVPSIQEQERIVRLLNLFDEATKNIVAQLEKEIELRNKKYEYYRNLLLSFPKENN